MIGTLKKIFIGTIIFVGLNLFFSCQNKVEKLPVLGKVTLHQKIVNGKTIYDSTVATIPDFSFVNQEGDTISQRNFADKIMVVDFFFTSCPSICPKMKAEMLKVYTTFLQDERVAILSHSIDSKRDSVAVLKKYAEKLGVATPKWQFVTGAKDSVYKIAEYYLAEVGEDSDAPGGYIHSGYFTLIDKKKQIRGYYDGTNSKDTEKLIADIKTLLAEKE